MSLDGNRLTFGSYEKINLMAFCIISVWCSNTRSASFNNNGGSFYAQRDSKGCQCDALVYFFSLRWVLHNTTANHFGQVVLTKLLTSRWINVWHLHWGCLTQLSSRWFQTQFSIKPLSKTNYNLSTNGRNYKLESSDLGYGHHHHHPRDHEWKRLLKFPAIPKV